MFGCRNIWSILRGGVEKDNIRSAIRDPQIFMDAECNCLHPLKYGEVVSGGV